MDSITVLAPIKDVACVPKLLFEPMHNDAVYPKNVHSPIVKVKNGKMRHF